MVFEFIIVAVIGLIVLGAYIKTGKLSSVFLGLSALTYLVLVSYSIFAYGYEDYAFNKTRIMVILIISGLIIMGAGYLLRSEGTTNAPSTTT